jgi:hypothetical protein
MLFVCLFIYILFNQAPKNLMTLNEMLEDYIRLKEKETMDKEKANLEHEKNQIQLQMVHNATTTYNVSGFIPPHAAKSTLTDVSQPAIISNRSHPGTIL